MSTPTYAAALFDFDGTLVDTMPLHFESYRRAFAEMELDLTPDQFYSQIGGTARETIPKFLGGRNAPWTVAEIHRRKKELLLTILEESDVRTLPTSHLLPLLHRRVPMAVATSGSRIGVERIIHRLGWTPYFGAIVTAEDVAHGKPAPDLFLLAAERLSVCAAECLAFEDTDDGVASARAAGAQVIDVRTTAAESACRQRP